jgi:hypothetical protein
MADEAFAVRVLDALSQQQSDRQLGKLSGSAFHVA